MFDAFYREGIIAIGWDDLGDLSRYPSADAIKKAIQEHRGDGVNPFHDALACYQFSREMAVGDIVFAKRGRREIVGYGVITSDYRHEPEREHYQHVRSIDWKLRGEWVPREKQLVTKTLTEIGKYPRLVGDINRALGIGDGVEQEPEVSLARCYSLDDALKELFLPSEEIAEALELLSYKKNLVLQGPPGVGKTFVAQHLAYLLLGEEDENRIERVQFHQSYSYDDFVQGYRPTEVGQFARTDGPFMRFCDQALQDRESPYVLVIDEINRVRISCRRKKPYDSGWLRSRKLGGGPLAGYGWVAKPTTEPTKKTLQWSHPTPKRSPMPTPILRTRVCTRRQSNERCRART